MTTKTTKMDIDASSSLEATPFLELLETFKLNNKHITIDELTNIIEQLDPKLQVFKVEQNYTEDFRKLVLYELEERVESLFLKITDQIIDKKDTLVSQAIAEWKKDRTNTAHITKIGTFKINVNFEYKDKMTQSQKLKSVSITYGELLTKYNIFKNAIQSAFAMSGLITTQSEFIKVFYNNAITTLGMRVSTARDLFDTAGVSAQCEAAHNIDWPSSSFPLVPNRFKTTYPEYKNYWRKYCYICGFEINAEYGQPSQCEHILPVFQACTFNCLIQVSTDMNTVSPLQKALYKLEYAGSHACCNILKSNNSFIIIDPTKKPPIRINVKYINELISLITKSKNQSDSLDCLKLLAGLAKLNTPIADFITTRVNEIRDDYLTPLVKALNMTLELNKSNQTYASSGIISLFLLLNQFISFEPAIEQTIIGILTSGSMTEKSHKLFLSYATATFITDNLEPIITELEHKGKIVVDEKNYLDIIGFIDVDSIDAAGKPYKDYKELLDRLSTENATAENIRFPRGLSLKSNYEFSSIKHLMSHFKNFYINKNFLNTNNYDDFSQMIKQMINLNPEFSQMINPAFSQMINPAFSQMINPVDYIPGVYPNTISSNLLELKIKIFFSTLLKQFYPYNATQSSFSKQEGSSLLEFCKAYIGLEFVYIIIYNLHKFHNQFGYEFEFFNHELINKINTCCANYKKYYMKFVTYFFIYQSIHILSTSNDKSLTIDEGNEPETIQEKKNTIITHSGETYYDIWILLSKDKVWFTNFISHFKDIIEKCGTEEAIHSDKVELQTITDGVASIEPELFKLFINLFDADAEFRKILTIYNVDSIGTKAFKKKIPPLPEKPSNAVADAVALADADAVAPAPAHAPDDDDPMLGGVVRSRDPKELKNELRTYRKSTIVDRRNEKRSDTRRDRRGIVKDNIITLITGLQKIEKIDIIDELQTRSSRSEITKYELRPNPTQLLQFNSDQYTSRLVINEAEGIYICIYSSVYISTIHRCILIDKYFLNKIVEMIDNEYVFSNGELLDTDTTDTQLLETLFQKDEAGNRVGGSALYNELFNNSNFFKHHPEYLPLFEKCNLFLYYDTADLSVRDIYDNKLYATKGGPILGGKKYYKKITKKLKNKKIVKKTKEKLKTKSRKHKSRKHKSRKHKSRKHKSKFTKTLKKKI